MKLKLIFTLYPTALQMMSLSRINYALLVFNIISILFLFLFLFISSLYNKLHNYITENVLWCQSIYGDQSIYLRGSYAGNQQFLVISIVIDSDRGHCCEHLKKINLQ